jgi:hypothetical protein
MSRTKDYFTPVEEPDTMPQEQTQSQDQGQLVFADQGQLVFADQGQLVFAHMIYQLTNNSKTELALD